MKSNININQKVLIRMAKILLFLLGALLFFAIAEDIWEKENFILDSTVYGVAVGMRCGGLTFIFKLLTSLVTPAVLAIVSVALLFVFRQGKYWVALFSNLVLTISLNVSVKNIFMRERPLEEVRLVAESGYSFPSGHSMMAASFYGFIIFLIWQMGMTRKKKISCTMGLLLLIGLIGFSRIYLGVHYATDVIGGFALSMMYLLVFTTVVKKYLEAGEMEVESHKNTVKNRNFLVSFGHAAAGIRAAFTHERNMLLHFCAMALVIVFGITLQISQTEWCICLILCGLVIALELVNTAIEAVVDMVMPEFHPKAKLAKDAAAGAVLFAAMMAAVVGVIIFFPKLWVLFSSAVG